MADIFGDQPVTNTDVSVDVLVGEGKKYSDVNSLARAYVNADSFIEELKRDNAMLRAQADANKMNSSTGNQEQPTPPQTPVVSAETPTPKDVDLRTLVSEAVQDLAQTKRFEDNVEVTAQRMVEVYGSPVKAQEALQQKARELGVNVEWLRDAAARSPSAFYATMGIPAGQVLSQSTPAPKNELNVSIQSNNSGDKNYTYYQNLRKENKSMYYSTEVQAEMQRLAREKGDAFYS